LDKFWTNISGFFRAEKKRKNFTAFSQNGKMGKLGKLISIPKKYFPEFGLFRFLDLHLFRAGGP